MLKIIGVLLISCALCAMGFVLAEQSKRRVHALEDAIGAVEILQTRVTHLLQPLSEAICSAAAQNPLLQRLADEACPITGEALQNALVHHGLGKPEREIMVSLFAAIPAQSAGETAAFVAAKEQLNIHLQLQRTAAQQSGALYPKLGVLAGAAAFLMLI